jgi:excisionase family DNA binding protein
MTHQTAAINVDRIGDDVPGRPASPQGPYWDLDLLTPDDVCALLKVKKSWLYDTVENGAIEAIHLGKQLRLTDPSAARPVPAGASEYSEGERVILDGRRHLFMLKRSCAIRDNAWESRPVAAVRPRRTATDLPEIMGHYL